jgi:ABC-type nickel/cobalt efflux system permease component RcnA
VLLLLLLLLLLLCCYCLASALPRHPVPLCFVLSRTNNSIQASRTHTPTHTHTHIHTHTYTHTRIHTRTHAHTHTHTHTYTQRPITPLSLVGVPGVPGPLWVGQAAEPLITGMFV